MAARDLNPLLSGVGHEEWTLGQLFRFNVNFTKISKKNVVPNSAKGEGDGLSAKCYLYHREWIYFAFLPVLLCFSSRTLANFDPSNGVSCVAIVGLRLLSCPLASADTVGILEVDKNQHSFTFEINRYLKKAYVLNISIDEFFFRKY